MPKTDLAALNQQLAERAANFNKTVAQSEGRRISIDQKTGNLIAPGDIVLGEEARIVVVDFCTSNKYYPGAYDPGNIVPPVCFAFGDVIDEMVPEEEAPEPQNEDCKTCPHNQWGSNGRGKACKNARELAVVLADELEDPDYEPELYHISVSPSSIKHFDQAAKRAFQLFDGMPIKAIFTLKAVQVKNYYEMHFSSPEANPHLERVLPLLEQSPGLIARTPDLSNYTPTRQQGRPGGRR